MITKHFTIRSKQRLGKKLKSKEIKGLLSKIRKRQFKLNKMSGFHEVYEVSIDNKPCQVVYDRYDDVLISIFIYKDYRPASWDSIALIVK